MTILDEFAEEVRGYNLKFDERESVEDAVADADVIYLESVVSPDYTKSREEAPDERQLTPSAYCITSDLLRRKGKGDALVMHSLPRMDEIAVDVDYTRHAGYWYEAYNCLLVRMALLALTLGAVE